MNKHSHRMTVRELKEALEKIPDNFTIAFLFQNDCGDVYTSDYCYCDEYNSENNKLDNSFYIYIEEKD